MPHVAMRQDVIADCIAQARVMPAHQASAAARARVVSS